MNSKGTILRLAMVSAAALAATACDRVSGFDYDLRGGAGQFDTSDAARSAMQAAPQPDARGVLTYPTYQVAVARRGDTVGTIAARLGLPAEDLARLNAIPQNLALRDGEIIALPETLPAAGMGTLDGPGGLDVASIAGGAIDRAEGAGAQPTRHRVAPGETAFSIARLYGVPVASLAEWNGLGPDLALREGQYLLIPTRRDGAPAGGGVEVAAIAPVETAPGAGSPTPVPPSASTPLPAETPKPQAAAAPARPAAESLGAQQSAASDTSRLRMPVQGRIILPYEKGKNEGIGIAASAGSAVGAADDGTVAVISRDSNGVPILVIRHEGNLLTVYSQIDKITVAKGDTVKRGQKVAEVRAGDPAYLHFEVRQGIDSIDPLTYLK